MKFIVPVIFTFLLSCLPQEEGRSAAIERMRVKPAPCAVKFEKKFSFEQIAGTAQKIKSECGLNENEVLQLAKEVYD